MEAVKQFNQDLSSLYETKPPISKAKMTSITKGAIKAIKFYKHVVQSVEKFIQKCRPEYKIPGLYVIDSIVRQSRHQFGPDKDVFAPRFSKNVKLTFYHLYKCPEEDKSKVIRVLNLWQKNQVFPSEVIQPLFDLANPNSELTRQMEDLAKSGKHGSSSSSQPQQQTPSKSGTGGIQVSSEFKTVDHQPGSNTLHQQSPATMSNNHPASAADQQMTQQLQTMLQLLKNHAQPDQVKFNKKLLDFDYSDEEDVVEQQEQQPSPAMLEALQGILENKVVLNKLKSMGAITDHQIAQLQQLLPSAQQQQQQALPQPPVQGIPGLPQAGLIQVNPPLGVPAPHQLHGQPFQQQPQVNLASQQIGGGAPPLLNMPMGWAGVAPSSVPLPLGPPAVQILDGKDGSFPQGDDEDIMIVEDHTGSASFRSGSGRRRSRSRDRDRKRSRRSRSRDRDRTRDHSGRSRRRSRSRSREGRRDREEDRQKQREREKKGLPPIRKGYLSVCSTTLWVGHLSKLVAEDELSDLFGEMGVVNTINLIPPRGCAFICMNRRMDANRALRKLHKHKLHGKPITLAWAPGKGMKDKQWRDYWDVDLGVSYIPIDKLDPQVNMAVLEEGGTFDDETMPEWMKTMRGVVPDSQMAPSAPSSGSGGAQYIPVPEGIPPPSTTLGVTPVVNPETAPAGGIPTTMSVTAGPPPGMPPPFGLPPPGAPPPPAAGLLPSGPPPNLAGILPPPGGPGLIGAAPPNLLLGAPLGQPPVAAGLMAGPPPALPGFDASQPPPGAPGLRLPFPPPGAGGGIRPRLLSPLLPDLANKPPPLMGEAPNGSVAEDSSQQDEGKDMNKALKEEQPPPVKRRESRWGREKSSEPPSETGEDGSKEKDNLAARLRSLAGMGEEAGSNNSGPPSFDKGNSDPSDGRPPQPPFHRGMFEEGHHPGPFREDDGGPPPPPFGSDGPPPPHLGQGRPPLFDAPPDGFGGMPPFAEGPPPPPFDGPNSGPPFMGAPPGGGGPRFGDAGVGVGVGPPPPFGDGFGPVRGRGGWRGRGGPPPFMDAPPPFGDGGGSQPPFGENFEDNFHDRPPWEGGHGRGRGGGFGRGFHPHAEERRRLPGLFDEMPRPFGEPNPPEDREEEERPAKKWKEDEHNESAGRDEASSSRTAPNESTDEGVEERPPGEEGEEAPGRDAATPLYDEELPAPSAEKESQDAEEPVRQHDAGLTAANLVGSLYEDEDEEEDEEENEGNGMQVEEEDGGQKLGEGFGDQGQVTPPCPPAEEAMEQSVDHLRDEEQQQSGGSHEVLVQEIREPVPQLLEGGEGVEEAAGPDVATYAAVAEQPSSEVTLSRDDLQHEEQPQQPAPASGEASDLSHGGAEILPAASPPAHQPVVEQQQFLEEHSAPVEEESEEIDVTGDTSNVDGGGAVSGAQGEEPPAED